ncbi:hypothetical protein ACFFGT_20430 [Mucilaginibacter angelicae]|uniref:Uncharacterized protein n=1 Tax=Mucilaginibacter angelicae TaxID=869718 RepID=A0ABV6LB00_9SPHI
MKKNLFLLAILLLGNVAYGQSNYLHLISPVNSTSNNPVSADEMTSRIRKDAENYARYAPVPRMAEMDYAFGADIEEYKKLNGFGVLYIPSLNRDSSEYPIKRVYVKVNNKIIELEKLGEIKVPVTDPQIISTFGRNRIDYYYLLPYQLTLKDSEVLIDWSTNRQNFTLTKFPNTGPIDFITTKNIGKNDGVIDKHTLKAFLKREFNVNSAD